jgi:hypothetical protein
VESSIPLAIVRLSAVWPQRMECHVTARDAGTHHVEAISRSLGFRGPSAGPLFHSLGNRGRLRANQRLETRSVLRIITTRRAAVGV